MRIARAALTFSLLCISLLAYAGEYAEMSARLSGAKDSEEVVRIVSENARLSADPDISGMLANEELTYDELAASLKEAVALRAMLEKPTAAAPNKADLKKIKSSPLYRDTGVDETSNWLSRALARLRNINLKFDGPKVNAGWLAGLGPILYGLFWTIIAISLGFLIYFAVKHFKWRGRLQRRASTLMEDSEPERTLDEWLELADQLESDGRYREAVRALYLACLLRFDEALVARFDRAQTNWEHLYRIEGSARKPEHLDFRTPTSLFDRVWYGNQGKGREEVAQFRDWYVAITESLRKVPA
ncbi:MAG: DUF4129 domain-containing protein [Fimbriimonas sp.]